MVNLSRVKTSYTYSSGAPRGAFQEFFTHQLHDSVVDGLNMGLINKVDMVCLSPVGYGV